MLHTTHDLKNFTLRAHDGEIGAVRDLYFDEISWTVRYLVVEAGAWLRSRKVLISPEAAQAPDWRQRQLPVDLTTEQIRTSPGTDTDQPVSRQHEAQMREHYRWPPYWGDGAVFAGTTMSMAGPVPVRVAVEAGPAGDPHLFSVNSVIGHRLGAVDGEIGHVEDFLVDEDDWRIRYVVIATRTWLPGRRVLVAPRWIERIDWPARQMTTDLSRDAIRQSPPYDPDQAMEPDYLGRLHSHYGRPQ